MTSRMAGLVLALSFAAACPAPPEPPCVGVQCAVALPFPTGSLPNDVALSRCGDEQVALVTASGDGQLLAHALPGGDVVAAAFFPVVDERGASPWSVDAPPSGGPAVVTLFGQDAVALVDPCNGRTFDVEKVDGQLTPQPVVLSAAGDVAFVGFTNVIAFSLAGEPPELGPGAVGVFDVEVAGDNGTLALDELRVLDSCANPQGLAPHDGDVLVSCSGALAQGNDGGQEAVSDGVVLVSSREGAHRIDAARLAPGTPAVVGDCLVAGSLVDPVLLTARLDDDALIVALELPGPSVDAVFKVVRWDDDTVLAVQFSADLLHVIDVQLDTCALTLAHSIEVGPGGIGFRGALSLDAQPGEPIDGALLLGLSAEVVPLQLGPVLP
jgi:hypothetical protein